MGRLKEVTTGELLVTTPLRSSSDRGGAPSAFLIRIARSHRPYDTEQLSVPLDNFTEVYWGRGEQDSIKALDDRRLNVTIDDPSLSTPHARLTHKTVAHRPVFMLEDLKSTNGCLVNGSRVTGPCSLEHGDMVETGQTFWKFHNRPVAHLDQLMTLAHDGAPITTSSSFSFEVLRLLSMLERIAPSDIPVIITGETGTGKEMMAVNIHQRSGRPGRYVALNCAAIPEGLIESELFGHCKGAFTGALDHKRGVIEAAHRGTLLLDEVGDMPLSAQAKLLRVLEEHEVVRVGETTERKVDVRFVAATNQNLTRMVERRTFREDLYARINVFPIELPPLRDRKEDLGILLAYFLLERQGRGGRVQVSHEFFRALTLHGWPFNIRELTKAVHVALTLAGPGDRLELEHLPAPLSRILDAPPGNQRSPRPATPPPRKQRLTRGQLKPTIVEALQQHGGNVAAVARQLDTSRMQVHRWMKKLQIDPNDYRG